MTVDPFLAGILSGALAAHILPQGWWIIRKPAMTDPIAARDAELQREIDKLSELLYQTDKRLQDACDRVDAANDRADTARQDGIALGLAMAAQKYQGMDVMDDDGFPAWDYFSAAHYAILAISPIPPHVAAARVLLDMPPNCDGMHVLPEHMRSALEHIAKEEW